jgi:hypothetical protein
MQNQRINKSSNFGATYAATNPIVTNQAMEFFQSQEGFVSVKDVPLIRVPVASGKLAVVKQEYINRDEVKLRSSSPTEADKATIGVGTVDFSTDSRALEYVLTAEDAAKIGYEYGMDVPALIPRALAMKANIHTEVRMSTLWASGSWYRTVTGAGSDSGTEGTTTMNRIKWTDATVNPVIGIIAEKRIFLLRNGVMPTNFRLGYNAFEKLATHPLVRAQIALTIGGASQAALYTPMATVAQLSALLGLNVSVSWGVKNTSNIDGTVTNAFIVDADDALMTYDGGGTYDATMGMNGQPSVSLTGSTGFARVAWTGVAPNGFQIRHLNREAIGAGGSQSWILDLFQGYVIVDSKFGTFFDGMTA